LPLKSKSTNPARVVDDSQKKRLLILASKLGYQTRGFADAAEKLGVDVVFGTDRCHKLDDPWGDSALPVHFERPREAAEEIAREMHDKPPEGIIALGDRPTPAAAFAAVALGIPGNSAEATEACRNKLWQREILAAAGLPVPEFFSFSLSEDVSRALPRVKFPCVLKPLGLAASQGVVRANDSAEFERGVERIRRLLTSPEIQVLREPGLDRLLVEKYIPGGEVAIEGLLTEGRLRILAIFDKPDPLEGPYFEETIYVTPSRLPERMQARIEDCAARTARALGLVTGPVHAEFRVNENGPWILEMAPRPIGGLCSRALRFGAERISLEELLVRHSLGLGGSELAREEAASGVMMIPVPRSGIFEGVEGVEDAELVGGIDEIRITARLKDYVAAWPEGSSYLGFIFAHGEKPADAEDSLRAAHAKLQFRFSPRLMVEHPGTRTMRQ
jgi:formate-dependent phosphoribosylglycinamide formyltransferase (GAR transformylase)